MLVQFGVERRLQHRLRQLPQHTIRPDQRHPVRAGLVDELTRDADVKTALNASCLRCRVGLPRVWLTPGLAGFQAAGAAV
ncbi:hypothetical protein GCM10017788_59980 [Amycolatopsis acidiphila]|nr:hypothetical protein GCM10017788_59980 [Amycolatopsis acidiphila]